MPRQRTPTEAAAGKLIAAIQKEWGSDLGEPSNAASEYAMEQAHRLLQASKEKRLETLLGNGLVADYLGPLWVKRHPSVADAIEELESLVSPARQTRDST